MDASSDSHSKNVRKIEDIIEIQKAKGNFNGRQVAFNLPSEANSTTSTNIAKCFESGISSNKSKFSQKKLKKIKSKRLKTPLPEVISWPSDSDITVLRMKLFLTKDDLKENVEGVIPGDGLHQPDSSSMVNLATLIAKTPSKHNMIVEECLLPLTSWELKQGQDHDRNLSDENSKQSSVVIDQITTHKPTSSQDDYEYYFSSRDSDYSKNTKKSKMARFLRLYFCPCCTCLYRLEKMQEEPSACFTKHQDCINVL